MIPLVAMTARGRLTWNAPTRMRNSPTKPLSPGRPMEERDDEKEHGHGGHNLPEATEVGDEPGVPPLVKHAHDQEEGAGGEAVVDHLNDAAHHALLVESEQPEHDEAQVADARVGDEFLDVGLHGGDA